jgi:CRP/FNR family transcriptional regulator, cyclic AMP receptor protein
MPRKPTTRRHPPHIDPLALLRRNGVIGGLSRNDLASLGAVSTTRTVPAGRSMTRATVSPALLAVHFGTLQITVSPSGGHGPVVKLLHAGESFGELALLGAPAPRIDAVAVTDTTLTVIPRDDLRRWVRERPQVAVRLIEILSTRLQQARQRLDEKTSLQVPARLARALLRRARNGSSDVSQVHVTQVELGRSIGATRESVNKTLRGFARRRWIRIERGSISVMSPAALQAVALDGSSSRAER